MSVSMTPTRWPLRATSTAKLAVVLDLPVPPRNEWVEMIFGKDEYSQQERHGRG
jgi:hypothetical protein